MPISVPCLISTPQNTSPWIVTGGFHTCLNQYREKPIPSLLLFEGDLNAAAKWMSRPNPGQNPNISLGFDFWFVLPVVDRTIYFVIGNQQDIRVAACQGYAIGVYNGDNTLRIYRVNAGVLTSLVSYGVVLAAGTLYHTRMTREYSGANRFWRLYLDDMNTPVAGPSASDATYTDFGWWGTDHLTNARCVWGGESSQW